MSDSIPVAQLIEEHNNHAITARQLDETAAKLARVEVAGEALAVIVRAYAKQYTDPRSRNGKRNSTALAQWEKLTKSHLAKDPAKAEDEGHD